MSINHSRLPPSHHRLILMTLRQQIDSWTAITSTATLSGTSGAIARFSAAFLKPLTLSCAPNHGDRGWRGPAVPAMLVEATHLTPPSARSNRSFVVLIGETGQVFTVPCHPPRARCLHGHRPPALRGCSLGSTKFSRKSSWRVDSYPESSRPVEKGRHPHPAPSRKP